MHTMMAATEDSFDIPGPETFMASQTMRPCAWKIKGLAALVLKMRYPGPRPAWTASLSMMVMMSPACSCRVDDVEFLFWPRLPNNRAWFISELMYFFEEVPFWWERACNQSFSQTIVEWPDWDVVAFQQILALAWSLQATNRDCTGCSLPQVTLMSPIE